MQVEAGEPPVCLGVPPSSQILGYLVQGNFAGSLQSAFNPAWDGVSCLNCTLPVPVISAAPASLSNKTSTSFSFSTVDG